VTTCQAQGEGGPFHCSACWGEGVPPVVLNDDTLPLPAHAWWTEAAAAAWLARAKTALGKRTHRSAPSLRATFRVVTDRDNAFFRGVGADKVWPAADQLCRCLDAGLEVAAGAGGAPGQLAVELGAGCGTAGMLLSRLGWRVVLTDLPWLLPLTALNIEANFAADEPARPAVHALRWGCRRDVQALADRLGRGAPDLVLGADVCYDLDAFSPLLDTLEWLGAPRCLLAVQRRDGCDTAFAAAASARGWKVSTVPELAEPAAAPDYGGAPPGSLAHQRHRSVLLRLERTAN